MNGNHRRFKSTELPVEIVQEILVIGASESKDLATRLSLLSKQVNGWVTPQLYHTVTLNRTTLATSFRNAICSASDMTTWLGQRPALSGLVRCLLIYLPEPRYSSDIAVESIESILRTCANLLHVALHIRYLDKLPASVTLPQSFELPGFGYPQALMGKHVPLLARVTHLDMSDWYFMDGSYQALLKLRRLTHICFDWDTVIRYTLIRPIIETKGSLKIIVIVFPGDISRKLLDYKAEKQKLDADNRVVFVGTRGSGPIGSLWAEAERLLDEKWMNLYSHPRTCF